MRQGARPHPRGPLVAPLADFFCLYISIYPKNIREHNRSGVPPPQASVATKNQSGPCSGTLPEGGIPLRWPSSSSRRSPWRGGSSSPSGLRVCTSSYVFDLSLSLSLSRVLDLARSWCIASFAIIVGSYDVSPPLLSCNGLSFPFEVILSDWVFKDLRTLDVCLACAYLWWQWDIHVIYLMYVLVINLRVQWPCELMHRGWHTFSSWLSGRNFGALFEVLCVGWIDESEIVWCISYNHTHGYLRWQWSI